jgi:hypothetical protein
MRRTRNVVAPLRETFLENIASRPQLGAQRIAPVTTPRKSSHERGEGCWQAPLLKGYFSELIR